MENGIALYEFSRGSDKSVKMIFSSQTFRSVVLYVYKHAQPQGDSSCVRKLHNFETCKIISIFY